MTGGRRGGRSWTVGELLFDLDGTLIDSAAAVDEAWSRWAHRFGLGPLVMSEIHGRTARDLVAALIPDVQVGEGRAEIDRLEAAPALPIPPTAGAVDLLRRLPVGSWAVVTSATERAARARAVAAGIVLPERLITADDVLSGKPDPEPYRRAMRFKPSAHASLVFEDTVAGLIAARAAGCTAIGVAGTLPAHELDAHADAVVRSLGEVRVDVADGALIVTLDGSGVVTGEGR